MEMCNVEWLTIYYTQGDDKTYISAIIEFTDKMVMMSCININLTLNKTIVSLWYLNYNTVGYD